MNLIGLIQNQNSRISFYIMRNVSVLFLAMIFIIGLVVFGNQFALIVRETVSQGIPVQELMSTIGFNMIKDISLIFSLSLFLAIILAISQLYKNSEAVVLNSFGFSDKNFIASIQPVVILVTVFILLLTTIIVPWAKEQKNLIVEEVQNASEFAFIKDGEFQEFKDGDIVFYASESSIPDDTKKQNMKEIFIYSSVDDRPLIVTASEAVKYKDPEANSIYLRLNDGVRYQGMPGDENKSILEFDQYYLQIVSSDNKEIDVVYNKIEGRSTFELLGETSSEVYAELQWRLSQPISIMILAVIGVLLGKTSTRSGKGIGLLVGIFIFSIYNNGLLLAKGALERGEISPWIGLWWVHLLVVILTLIIYQNRQRNLFKHLDKISNFYTKRKNNA